MARNANLVAVKVIAAVSGAPWSDSIEGLEWIVNRVQMKKDQGHTTRSVVGNYFVDLSHLAHLP